MDIDAFILIGGRSERFGRDKAFFEYEGETLATRAARTVDTALSPAHLTFVTSTDDQFGAELLFGLGRPIIADLKPGFGAWSGLHTALGYAGTEWAFVLPCDLPFVSAEGLRAMASALASDVDAVVPRQPDGRLQPLCAFYRVEMLRPIVDELMSENRSLPALAAVSGLIRTRVVEVDALGSEDFFHNVNTPDDVSKQM